MNNAIPKTENSETIDKKFAKELVENLDLLNETSAIMQDLIISVLMRPGNQWSSHLLLKYYGWETQSVFHLHYNGNSLRCMFTIYDDDIVHIMLEHEFTPGIPDVRTISYKLSYLLNPANFTANNCEDLSLQYVNISGRLNKEFLVPILIPLSVPGGRVRSRPEEE